MKSLSKYLLIIIILIFSSLSPITLLAQSTTNLDIKYTPDAYNEVIPGHNIPDSKDRINLVFYTIDDNPNYAKYVGDNIRNLIGWDGPIVYQTSQNIMDISYGFFSEDPTRDYKNRFNIWYVPTKDGSYIHPTMQALKKYDNRIEVNLINRAGESSSTLWKRGYGYDLEYFRTDQNFKGAVGDISLTVDMVFFDSVMTSARTLTHELGHALFRFADEYYTFGDRRFTQKFHHEINKDLMKQVTNINSNCAINDEEGKAKWSKYIGSIDSMVYEIIEDYKSAGIDKKINPEDHKVGYYPVQFCHPKTKNSEIDKIGFVVPTQNAIMTDTPIQIDYWGDHSKEYIKNFFNSEVKGEGEAIPYIKKPITQEYTKQLMATTYYAKYGKIAKDVYKHEFWRTYTNQEYMNMKQWNIDNLHPLDVPIRSSPPSYLGYRQDMIFRLKLDRTPLNAGIIPFVNLKYGVFMNEYVLYIYDIIFTLIILKLLDYIIKSIKKFRSKGKSK